LDIKDIHYKGVHTQPFSNIQKYTTMIFIFILISLAIGILITFLFYLLKFKYKKQEKISFQTFLIKEDTAMGVFLFVIAFTFLLKFALYPNLIENTSNKIELILKKGDQFYLADSISKASEYYVLAEDYINSFRGKLFPFGGDIYNRLAIVESKKDNSETEIQNLINKSLKYDYSPWPFNLDHNLSLIYYEKLLNKDPDNPVLKGLYITEKYFMDWEYYLNSNFKEIDIKKHVKFDGTPAALSGSSELWPDSVGDPIFKQRKNLLHLNNNWYMYARLNGELPEKIKSHGNIAEFTIVKQKVITKLFKNEEIENDGNTVFFLDNTLSDTLIIRYSDNFSKSALIPPNHHTLLRPQEGKYIVFLVVYGKIAVYAHFSVVAPKDYSWSLAIPYNEYETESATYK